MPGRFSFGFSTGASRIIACAAERGLLHDISQPLSAIRNYSHVLKTFPSAGALPEAQLTLIHHLDAEIDRIVEMLRNTQRTELQDIESCDLHTALEDAVLLIDHTGDPLAQMTLPADSVTVAGDRPVIAQVLFSLVDAAMSRGGAVRVSVTADGDGAVIAVESSGGPVSNHEGRGLGLALCRRIAQVLGGSLAEEGTEEGGRTWRLRLPLASVAGEP